MTEKNNEKTIKAWAMFDWANSAYNLVITSTIFQHTIPSSPPPKNTATKYTFWGNDLPIRPYRTTLYQ